MKSTTLAIGALAVVAQLAVAQPHRHKHAKKDVVITVTDIVYAEPTDAPEVVVFVNQFGEPVSTMTEGMLAYAPSIWSTLHGTPSIAAAVPESTSTPTSTTSLSSTTTLSTVVSTPSVVAAAPVVASTASVAAVVSVEAVAAPVENVVASTSVAVVEAKPATTSIAPVVVATSTSAAATQTSAAAASSGGFGLSYSPYNSDGTCKTSAQVLTDFETIGSQYSIIRTYGTDCNQVANVLVAAKKYSMKMFVGIYDLTAANLASEVKLITDACSSSWAYVDTVSVGNEGVNSGTYSPATVVAAISTVRGLLTTAGYTGKVVTVDTLVAMRENPQLCDASDYCAANCHPFFDGNVAASGAGDFITTQIPTLRAVLANSAQEIVITETGWPWQGETNGAAVPSTANQATAISSIKSAFTDNQAGVILFTAFNDLWKTNTAAQFQAEQYWGFLGDCPSG